MRFQMIAAAGLALSACGGPQDDGPPQVADDDLALCIRAHLNFTPDSKISDDAAASLVNLDCPDEGITSVEGLDRFSNLETLSLWENELTDIRPLGKLRNLRWLELGNNNISDVAPLSALGGLSRLGLAHNQISNLSALGGLSQLEWLNLDDNDITDVSALSGLGNITWLTIEHNAVTNDSVLDDFEDDGADVYGQNQSGDGPSGPPPMGGSASIDASEGTLLGWTDENGQIGLDFAVRGVSFPVISELSSSLMLRDDSIVLGNTVVGTLTNGIADLCGAEHDCNLALGVKMAPAEAYAGLAPEPVVTLSIGVHARPEIDDQEDAYGVRDETLIPYVLASPNQFDAGSCLFMTTTGAMELLIHQHTDLDTVEYEGDTDLSERFLMAAYNDVPSSRLRYWLTDTLYTYNYVGGSMLNRDYPFTAGYVRETSSGSVVPCEPGDSGAYYSCSYNWFDERPDNWEDMLVATPDADRTVVYTDPTRSSQAQWNVGLMDDEDVEKIKYMLRTRKVPVVVIYNHYMYWHADMIVGYDDSIETDGCPMVESSMDYFDDEGAGGYTQAIERHMDDIGDCTNQGIFYVRDSIYEGTSEEPEYEYSNGFTERYSQRIIERSYNWVKYLGNHAYSVHRK